MKNETEIQENLRVAKENLKDLYEQKRLRYEEIDRTAAITIPDTLLMTATNGVSTIVIGWFVMSPV